MSDFSNCSEEITKAAERLGLARSIGPVFIESDVSLIFGMYMIVLKPHRPIPGSLFYNFKYRYLKG